MYIISKFQIIFKNIVESIYSSVFTHILLQGRARQLYKAGYRNLQSIAKADVREIKEKIPYLSNKMVMQIITAAKVSCYIIKKYINTNTQFSNKFQLLILQKAEDLKDEWEDILDGIHMSQIGAGL